MNANKILNLLDGEVISGSEFLTREVEFAFGSDLMSDVLAYAEENTVLLTGLVNNQVIRTAEMLDLKVIVFLRGKKPSDEIVKLAKEDEITLLTTHHSMFSASGILFSNGLDGTSM